MELLSLTTSAKTVDFYIRIIVYSFQPSKSAIFADILTWASPKCSVWIEYC